MNIAIIGMGVAGSYLSSMLSQEHQVSGFDRLQKENFDAVCAWGTAKAGIEIFAKNCGLNFEDYITFTGKEMLVEVNGEMVDIDLMGLCCFDKIRFINDMADGINIEFGKYVSKNTLNDDYDMLVDSTGLIRPLLPRVKEDLLIPCMQYRVKYNDPPFDDFYVKPFPGLSGYFWYFPLGDGFFHIGAGDYYQRHNEEISNFLKKYPAEIVKKNGRPVRISPPSLCEPFYEGKVVGVGESIGTVYPILGEGIIPSLQCADLLLENLNDLSNYRKRVLEEFKIYDLVYKVIKSKIAHEFNVASNFYSLWSIYRYMKKREDRYGMNIRMRKLLKIVVGS
jgi:flavin-dependent dehydrogenase|tara:strand:- start:3721 stop:4728 length:1008 start_codon:yes stop_codon:yes gene_type:complete